MNQSFLIFGREPSVSFAELYQYLGDTKENIALAAPSGAIINDESLAKDAPFKLAGVIKSGVVAKTLDKLTAEALAEILQGFVKADGKLHFGISIYGLGKDRGGWDAKKLGLSVKTILKNAGRSVRLVESRSGNLSSVDVAKNKLLRTGAELCIFVTPTGFLIGKTEAVQPFEDYSHRDYDRPGRDAKNGMLPPKLALAMVNMAVGQRARHAFPLQILDPFCGSGTVLQEALLLGHQVIGTDIDEQAIKNSKMNLEWLFSRHPELVEGSHRQPVKSGDPSTPLRSAQDDDASRWRVEQVDVRNLSKILSPQSVDAIVAEFDLGPPLQGGESVGKIDSIVFSLSDFYFDALRALRPFLKPGGRVVVAWPHFRTQGVLVSTFSKLRDLGWSLVAPYPLEFEKNFPLSERGTLLYGREGQHVGREILILKKAGG